MRNMLIMFVCLGWAGGLMAQGSAVESAEPVKVRVLTLADAETMIDAALIHARSNNWKVAVAVVDPGGYLIMLKRVDGMDIGCIAIAINKAKTATLFKKPTKHFQKMLLEDKFLALSSIADIVPIEGGLPIMCCCSNVIGAIGVSGVAPGDDGSIAEAGLKALKLKK